MMGKGRVFLALGLSIATGAAAWGYAFVGSKWASSPVVMHLQLGSSGTLIDGSSSWNASAEDALATWNKYLLRMQFSVVRNSTVTPRDGDSVNNVFFDNTVYGFSFGGAVAITTEWTVNDGQRRVEADTIFNSSLDWNSYRGNLKNSTSGDTLYDLHRVALHEFGHTVGLDHPDENGQALTAIMNSRVSNVDHLMPDDIRGGQALYGARATTTPRASFTKPSTARVKTTAASYLFRGRAVVSRVKAVYLVNTRLGTRQYFKAAGVKAWRRKLALRPGKNVVRLYVVTAGGSLAKVGKRTVDRD